MTTAGSGTKRQTTTNMAHSLWFSNDYRVMRESHQSFLLVQENHPENAAALSATFSRLDYFILTILFYLEFMANYCFLRCLEINSDINLKPTPGFEFFLDLFRRVDIFK